MIGRKLYLTVLIILVVMPGACAPQAASTPSSPPTGSVPAQANPVPITPSASLQDATWAKVVETAKKEGVLTMYGSAQIAGPLGVAIAKAFKDRFGISVEMLVSAGRQSVERVQVEARMNMPVGDVVFSGISSAT